MLNDVKRERRNIDVYLKARVREDHPLNELVFDEWSHGRHTVFRGSGTYADMRSGPHLILGRVYTFTKQNILSSHGHGRGFSLVRTWFKYVPLPLTMIE